MKIISKIIIITIISTLIIFNIPLYSKATTTSLDGIIDKGNSFLNESGSSSNVAQPSKDGLKELSDSVSGILLTIALGVTVISVAIMGINFIIQSVEEKAKIKESMVPWIIGIFISFGAYGIWNITIRIFSNF